MKILSLHATTSHEFQFAGRALLRLIAPSVVSFIGIVALLHLLNALAWLPAPTRVEGTEEALIRRRLEMTRTNHPAEVLIIGDSSSAIAVEAPLLSTLLPGQPRVLNQGLFMALSLDNFGRAATEFIKNHPGQVKLLVLIITTDKLRSSGPNEFYQSFWTELAMGREPRDDGVKIERWLGIPLVRSRLVNQLVPFAAYGRSGRFYAGDYHLQRYLPLHDGTMMELGWYNPPGSTHRPVWRISEPTMKEALELRTLLVSNVPLVVGIAPVPDSFADASFQSVRDELLNELNAILKADLLLTNLPARFPNGFCSSPIHLNPRGQEHFTRLLAAELSRLPMWTTNAGAAR